MIAHLTPAQREQLLHALDDAMQARAKEEDDCIDCEPGMPCRGDRCVHAIIGSEYDALYTLIEVTK